MKKSGIALFLLAVVVLSACDSGEAGKKGNEEKGDVIYTTVYPLQFMTEKIAGETLEVESILPAGADAHTYEPTTKEMVRMAEGEVFIYTKDDFEAYAETIADTLEAEDVRTVAAAEGLGGLKKENGHEEKEGGDHDGHSHSSSGEDPHIWLDPVIMTEVAEEIEKELATMYPEKKDEFSENTKKLKARLHELDERMAATVKEADTQEVIVSHAAYGYWEDAYGLKQISVAGLSSTNEPSQKELEHVIETAEEHGLNYVLFEKNVSMKAADIVQEEIGAEALYLHNLATRTEEEAEKGKDYFDIMEENREVLEQALNR
ncbi:metal ABC transporter substrate-binding protein [Salimicrobium album]|uniref:Zinc transport system substrate-binding protein n=1 Tax=Salimicrobium album TaxID=50717 RepID=A0A1H3HK90_9BACI|nr:zinc ABC transporter substrate-binding protein [Salimicrobium album]SDY15079.1 zinc transport system substrate-binding protein [Salimicrobium album]